MQQEHLAIASVPCQTWGPIYNLNEALKIGTIFTELNKPFFAADQVEMETDNCEQMPLKDEEQIQRETLLQEIYEVSFFLDDLTLYLDTHCEDSQAGQIYLEHLNKRTKLKQEFAQKFYPLTRECLIYTEGNINQFCWQEGPMPWEGACI